MLCGAVVELPFHDPARTLGVTLRSADGRINHGSMTHTMFAYVGNE